MSNPVLLGIDLGTTVLKLCALDAKTGECLAHATCRLTVQSFPNGGREIALGSIDRAFDEAIVEIRSKLDSQWNQLSGIGLAAQAGSSILADRRTGKPHTPMILWNDSRSCSYTRKITESQPACYWRRYILNDLPPAGLGRLLWLKENHPDLFHEGNIHIGAGEYLYFRLTGIWTQDAGNAIQIGSYNADSKSLVSTLFDLIDVPISFVAPLRYQHRKHPISSSAEQRWNLPSGIPVAGPYFDQEASYLASTGEATSFPLQVSLGTAWVGNFVMPDHCTGMSPTQLPVPSPLKGDGRLVVQPLMTGNLTWEWGLEHFVDKNLPKALIKAKELLDTSILPPKGLIAVPWFTQTNPFQSSSYGAGAFMGLNDQTGEEDLFRALTVSLPFELARMFDEVKNSEIVDSVVIGGGASQAEHFCKLIAALFHPLPVYRFIDQELSTARGAVYAFMEKETPSEQKKPSRVRKNIRRNLDPYREQITQSDERFISETRNALKTYREIFEKIFCDVPFSKAYQWVGSM